MRKSALLLHLGMLVFLVNCFGQSSLNFNGSTSYVNITNDTTLHLTSFTLEAWVRPEGTGITTNTGIGGITAIPIISKGRGEADAPSNLNVNYFLGINANKKLCADFEEANGANHPVVSKTSIPDSIWTHVAVSYQQSTSDWRLYINGILDTTKNIGSNIVPANVSIQPAAIASALNSSSTPAGYFKGKIDEVRIWNIARSATDIFNNYKSELTSGSGLVARYGLNEGMGSVATNSIAAASNGTIINNPLWTANFNSTSVTNEISTVTVSSGWTEAVGLTFNQTGSQMFVWERGGKVWVVENNVKKLLLNISPEVGGYRDLGLLGFALSPQFETNGYIYLLYTVDRHHLLYYGTSSYSPTANLYNAATIGRLTRYTATKTSTGYNVDTLSRKILIGATKTNGIPEVYLYHHLGSLVFGRDGSLLVCTGDGATSALVDTGSASGTYYQQALADGIITSKENVGSFRSQLLECYNGKILRIDAETGNGLDSNPFYESTNPGSIRSKVWALGLRNPFRMTLKPGTGSTNIADGNPGVLYLGDVGYVTWEELDVINKPGMNLGWPVFEGLTYNTGYANTNTYNYNAPNPLYGTNGCTQQYFYFKDLIKQANSSGTATFTNPCNTSQAIPSTIKTFMHSLPIIDWKHGAAGPSRTGIFNSSGAATTINIGATGSPVSGPQFGGSCDIGGVFYTHDDFPAEYRNSFIFGDYSNKWIRSISMDGSDKPIAVRNLIDTGAMVVAMATHPTEGGLYYINFTSEIRKVTYNNSNRPPVAVGSSDKEYGPSPLSVQFTGSASSDPDGQPLTYLWKFKDGTTSTAANPSHTFTAPSIAPITYPVSLTVKDSQGGVDSIQLQISVNNTPPSVTITSPVNGTLYSVVNETTYNLRATVTDKEHSSSQLFYKWQTILHHATHEHPEPVDTNRVTTTVLSTLGCDELYYYRILLTVTDAAGLSTTKEVQLFPDCSQKVTSFTLVNAETDKDIQTLVNGTTLYLKSLPTQKLNIRANVNPATVGSVVFNLTGAQAHNQTEGKAPYSLFGDTNGDYVIWIPSEGNYTLKATPYTGANSSGTAGTGLAINFNVTNNATATQATTKSSVVAEETANNNCVITYYPNPNNTHHLTLSFCKELKGIVNIEIFDAAGKLQLKKEYSSVNNKVSFDHRLARGTYSIVVRGDNLRVVKKLVVLH